MAKGAYWVIGILLLIGMFVGARMLFPNSAASTGTNLNDGPTAPPAAIICWGNFDVEKGVALLYPRQFGNVVFIHEESTRAKEGELVKVKEGDLLLQVDDALAKLKVDEAKQDVNAGVQQLEEAKKLPELYAEQIKQQQAVIAAVELDKKKTERDRDSKLDSLDNSPGLKKIVREMYEFGLGQLDQKKLAEESKLRQIKLQDASIKLKQAEADLEAKKIRHREAEEMLKHFKIVAPSDGYVLRVHARKGETLGPNPRAPAVEFLPDAPIIVRAEVLQEWGRFVKPGKEVIIEDDTYKGPEWKGVVKRVSDWYLPTRSPVIEPFRYNDVRTLECIIEIAPSEQPKKIGQRVRARIKI